MKNYKLVSICLLFAVLLCAGCKSDENISPDESNQPDEGSVNQNVYVAGYENNTQSNPVARLWKNGSVQNLLSSDGSIRSSDTDFKLIQAKANSVFVAGEDVYVAGYEVFQKETAVENGMNYETTVHARLWKNGVIQNLANEDSSDQTAISVFVSGNDVYVLGYEFVNQSKTLLKCWKNGQAEIFAEGDPAWQANSIFVSNGDVYIVGRGGSPYGLQAMLWKNGVAEYLDSGTAHSCANSVFVAGNDVYVVGNEEAYKEEENGGGRWFFRAKLWKNGKAENLTNDTENADALSVYIEGEDIYVAGVDIFDGARLWKNGIVQDMPDAKDAALFQSVFVLGNDVYLAGYVTTIEDVGGGLSIGRYQATLWKNGQKLNLAVENNDSWAVSVFVK